MLANIYEWGYNVADCGMFSCFSWDAKTGAAAFSGELSDAVGLSCAIFERLCF